MRVLEKTEDLQIPGVCFLCEQLPDFKSGTVKVIDTGMHFAQEKYVHLAGRKYVCESCLQGLVNAVMDYSFTHEDENE